MTPEEIKKQMEEDTRFCDAYMWMQQRTKELKAAGKLKYKPVPRPYGFVKTKLVDGKFVFNGYLADEEGNAL